MRTFWVVLFVLAATGGGWLVLARAMEDGSARAVRPAESRERTLAPRAEAREADDAATSDTAPRGKPEAAADERSAPPAPQPREDSAAPASTSAEVGVGEVGAVDAAEVMRLARAAAPTSVLDDRSVEGSAAEAGGASPGAASPATEPRGDEPPVQPEPEPDARADEPPVAPVPSRVGGPSADERSAPSEPEPRADEPSVPPPAARSDPAPDGAAPLNDAADDPTVVKILRREDGTMLVDDRFIVRGSGTAADPYQVSWDLLVSAGEVYQPRQGRHDLPGRITMLKGKHVRITGNIAFPLMAEEAGELLVMLNQWDGCCIGVPPTPYDAIEVRLDKAVGGDDRFVTYGTITGRFDVQPHLVGNWLVGLYVIEQATLQPQSFGGFDY